MAQLTQEHAMLRDMARGWAMEKSPVRVLRRLRDSGDAIGYDRAVFADMVAMGWTGVLVPEAFGGSDFGAVALGLILEETGRTLTASPLLASALAAATALNLGATSAQKHQWLPRIAVGTCVGTLAIDEGPRHRPTHVAMRAEAAAGGYVLDGRKLFVPDGLAADLLIVSARTGGDVDATRGISLFLVDGNAVGVSRQGLRLADSRGAANVGFDRVAVPADALLGDEGEGHLLLERILDRARAGVAAEMLGMAAQAFETTLDYLKTRVQFGQVIGSFQALQHRAARIFIDLELARSCVESALAAIDDDSPDVPALVSLAKARVGETLLLVSNEMIQLHGGIGMTDAHDAGLYLKRARTVEALYGNQAFHRERYARLHGI